MSYLLKENVVWRHNSTDHNVATHFGRKQQLDKKQKMLATIQEIEKQEIDLPGWNRVKQVGWLLFLEQHLSEP